MDDTTTKQQQTAPIAPDNTTVSYPVEFRGSAGEYFKIWTVNVLLTIITLYIYSAWAKVRTKRYFYGNTFVDNSSFEYHARPTQLLLGRFIGLFLLVFFIASEYLSAPLAIAIYFILVIALPWIVWRSILFNMRVSSYRNVRFGFRKNAKELYLALLKPALLPLVVGIILSVMILKPDIVPPDEYNYTKALGLFFLASYLVLPWYNRNFSHYIINGTRYGIANFAAELTVGRYYKIYVVSLVIVVAVIVAMVGLVVVLLTFAGIIDFNVVTENLNLNIDPDNPGLIWPYVVSGILVYVLLLAMFIFAGAYIFARLRNYRYNQTTIEDRVSFTSTLEARGLMWLYSTNMIAIILTLGLAYPWTKVRNARYYAKHTMVHSRESLDNFVGEQVERSSALGEELGDAFDLDIGAGL